jgi:DNA-binding FadR family transcriptional regulator
MPRTERSYEVEAEIEARIRSGAWPVGRCIGTMRELAAQLGCSRSSLHRALTSLRDRGMVVIAPATPDSRVNSAFVADPAARHC